MNNAGPERNDVGAKKDKDHSLRSGVASWMKEDWVRTFLLGAAVSGFMISEGIKEHDTIKETNQYQEMESFGLATGQEVREVQLLFEDLETISKKYGSLQWQEQKKEVLDRIAVYLTKDFGQAQISAAEAAKKMNVLVGAAIMRGGMDASLTKLLLELKDYWSNKAKEH